MAENETRVAETVARLRAEADRLLGEAALIEQLYERAVKGEAEAARLFDMFVSTPGQSLSEQLDMARSIAGLQGAAQHA